MPDINRSLIVPYSPEEMYSLVNKVEEYAHFLPWCSASHVIHRDEDEVRASLTISAAGLQKDFTTLNRLQKNKMIEIRLVDGPFKHLEGFWRFAKQENNGCEVLLNLEFEFAGYWLDMTIGPVFQKIANTLVDAFSDRAIDIYGER